MVKKLTHPDLPRDVYLLVRDPQTSHSSNNNIHESYEIPNDISSDILASDLSSTPTHRERLQLKLKHHTKLNKREALPPAQQVCCGNRKECIKLNCH
jgi:hypothetical protein